MRHPVKILQDAPRPPVRTGRRKKWDLPLAELGENDILLIEMDEDTARDSIVSIRSATSRETQRTGVRYSVYLCEDGVKVWQRREDDE